MNSNIPPRLQWSCRRGMLELDMILSRFLNEAYLHLSLDEQGLFVKLLDCQDQDLFQWLTGNEQPIDSELIYIVNKVREHVRTPSTQR